MHIITQPDNAEQNPAAETSGLRSGLGLDHAAILLNRDLAKIWQIAHVSGMATMNISLPDALKSFVDEQVISRGYGTSSEYVRELIREDRDRQRLRAMLLDGAGSTPASPADTAFFDALRERVRRHNPA